MKTLRFRSIALIAFGMIAMMAITPTARADTGVGTLVSAKHGDVSQVATTDLAQLTDTLGVKGLTVGVKAFGGLTFEGGKLQGGLALSVRRPISRELDADVGLFGRFTQGRASDAGLYLGFGWRI
jgi:hypothetical protein